MEDGALRRLRAVQARNDSSKKMFSSFRRWRGGDGAARRLYQLQPSTFNDLRQSQIMVTAQPGHVV